MNYKIKMMDKEVFIINESDFKNILGKNGMVLISSLKILINMSCVSSISPLEEETIKTDEVYYLCDGARVKKKFGTWVDADDQEIKIDISYYKELRDDLVFTKSEFESVKELNLIDRLNKLEEKKKTIKIVD